MTAEQNKSSRRMIDNKEARPIKTAGDIHMKIFRGRKTPDGAGRTKNTGVLFEGDIPKTHRTE